MAFFQRVFGSCVPAYHSAGRSVAHDEFYTIRREGRDLPADPRTTPSETETERTSLHSVPTADPVCNPDAIVRLEKTPDHEPRYPSTSTSTSTSEAQSLSSAERDDGHAPAEVNIFALAAQVPRQRGSSKAANYAYRYRLEKKLGPHFPNNLGPYFKAGQLHDFLEDSCLVLGPEYKRCRWDA